MVTKNKKKNVCITLSEKHIKALELFSEQIGLSKSAIVGLALSNYLMPKDEFRNNPKARELLNDEIELFENSKR